MKRRLFLLLGASTMTVTSLVGFTVATTTPAAAAPNPFVSIGYIIQCLTPQHLINDFAVCLVNAINDLVSSLSLPTSLGANATPHLPTTLGPGANAPALTLPTNVTSILKTLPPALQTTPVAGLPAVQAPLTQLIPSLPTRSNGSSTSLLPKVPALTAIKFLNVSDSKTPSSGPISSSDLVGVVALGLLGASALVFQRRRAAVAS